MYEDGQDEVVLTVDRPCQLLGVGFCGTEGGLTVELDVYEVRRLRVFITLIRLPVLLTEYKLM